MKKDIKNYLKLRRHIQKKLYFPNFNKNINENQEINDQN